MAKKAIAAKDGIIAINIKDDDELVAVRRTSGDDEVLMVSRAGGICDAGPIATIFPRSTAKDCSAMRSVQTNRPPLITRSSVSVMLSESIGCVTAPTRRYRWRQRRGRYCAHAD